MTFPVGSTFRMNAQGDLYLEEYQIDGSKHWMPSIMAYHHTTLEKFKDEFKEWFEEIDSQSGSFDYDMFVIDSENPNSEEGQIRDCIKDAFEQLNARIKKLEEGRNG
ncbi:hypothetical protein IKF63_01165 [Candidatus Saccharibacteria bacterium]|nr:hypothetical protein [Candidatus Saccharibacteria bacterium]